MIGYAERVKSALTPQPREQGDLTKLGAAAAAVTVTLATALTGAGLVLAPTSAGETVLPLSSHPGSGSGGPAALPPSELVRLTISAIDLDTEDVVELRPTPTAAMEVPDDPGTIGWFAPSQTPGEPGASVLTGHVDLAAERGVFHRLRELGSGDTVSAYRADGSRAVFTIYRVEDAADQRAAIEEATSPTQRPELRLLTCAAAAEQRAGGHQARIVFAHLTGGSSVP